MHLYASALWAGLVAYLLGAFFASTAYDLFPYYMITYATLLYKIAAQQPEGDTVSVVRKPVRVPERSYSPA